MILIHSIVEGGAADLDGRLHVGDRLLHVNHTTVQDETLEFTVNLLTSIPLGSTAVIGVNHPLPNASDINGSSCWPVSPESVMTDEDYASRRVEVARGRARDGGGEEEEEEEEEDVDEDEDGFGRFSEQSTVVGGNESHQLQDVSEQED